MSPSVWTLTLCVLGIEREGTSVDDKWSRRHRDWIGIGHLSWNHRMKTLKKKTRMF